VTGETSQDTSPKVRSDVNDKHNLPRIRSSSNPGRAAGPGPAFAPLRLPLDEEGLLTLTPQLAKELLARNVANYRSLDRALVAQYADLMRRGLWLENGDAIRFDRDGVLLDFQHRLWAVVESGVTIQTRVVTGLDPKAAHTIDSGRHRALATHLAHAGYRNVRCLGGAARWLIAWRKGSLAGEKPCLPWNLTYNDVEEYLRKEPGIEDGVRWVSSNTEAARLIEPSVLAFLWYAFGLADAKKRDFFFDKLQAGMGVEHGVRHPVYLLHRWLSRAALSKQKMPREEKVAVTILAWRHFHEKGEQMPTKHLVWRSQGAAAQQFPVLPQYPPPRVDLGAGRNGCPT
jgi:hypothetical protein